MARIKLIRGTNLPNTATKTDCHNLVDDATAQIYDITGSEVKSDAAIVDTKLNTISTIGKINLSALVCASQAAGDILYMNNAGQVIRLPIGTAGQKLRVGNIQMDYFEYATDLLAQTAYPTNSNSYGTGGSITTVGNDVVHTFTSSGTFVPLVTGTYKVLVVGGGGGGSAGGGGGGGVVYNATKSLTGGQSYTVTIGGGGAGGATNVGNGSTGGNSVFGDITAYGGGGGGAINLGGSNGGSGGGAGASANSQAVGSGSQGYAGGNNYTTTPYPAGGGGGAGSVGAAATSGTGGNGGTGYETTILDNTTDYYAGGGGGGGYAAVTPGTGTHGGGNGASGSNGADASANTGGGGGGSTDAYAGGAGGSGIVIVRYPAVLTCYSESSIKSQGTYALKGVAQATDSLNDTLTKTVSPTIDLSGINTLKFDIRSSRTGSNIKIGIHDSGGTTSETTPNITSANAWQTVTWDISGVSNANKDAIDSIIITIVNADAANTFYLDNFFIYGATNILEWVTP